jgi:hypothetical protein
VRTTNITHLHSILDTTSLQINLSGSPEEVQDSKERFVGIANGKCNEIYDDPEIPCTMTLPEF